MTAEGRRIIHQLVDAYNVPAEDLLRPEGVMLRVSALNAMYEYIDRLQQAVEDAHYELARRVA